MLETADSGNRDIKTHLLKLKFEKTNKSAGIVQL